MRAKTRGNPQKVSSVRMKLFTLQIQARLMIVSSLTSSRCISRDASRGDERLLLAEQGAVRVSEARVLRMNNTRVGDKETHEDEDGGGDAENPARDRQSGTMDFEECNFRRRATMATSTYRAV